MQITPYIFLNGRCEEAIDFYVGALGAKVTFLHRFKDAPTQGDACMGPPEGIMHATLQIGDSLLHVSDGDGRPQAMAGACLSVSVMSVDEGERIFKRLSDGGQVTMQYQKTFWTEGFGMLTDRFGIAWMINCEH